MGGETDGKGREWKERVETGKEESKGERERRCPFEKPLDPPRILRNKSELKLTKITNVTKTKTNSKTEIALTLRTDVQVIS